MPTLADKINKDSPLKAGMTSDVVKQAQIALAAYSYPLLGTGYFGPATRDAVKAFQTSQGLPITGVIDVATATALDKPVTVKATEKKPLADDTPPWLKTAIESIGIAEVPGKKDNPAIMAMAKACGGVIAKTYTHDEVPWCKMFTEYCLVKNGLKGVDSLWALDNIKLGSKLKNVAVGAIASKQRKGGGHTFIVIGRDKNGKIVGVGGNQTDRVSRATFYPSEIISYNWPTGYPEPTKFGFSSLPVVDSAPLSKREV